MVNILFSTDDKYVMPLVVLMNSIGINCKRKKHYYIIVDESFAETSEKDVVKTASSYGDEVSFCKVTSELIGKIPFANAEMPPGLSIATYYRLFLTELLPLDVHKVLYLDVDMIVRHSLDSLWDTDINDYAIAAVPDMDEQSHIESNRLPYPMETGYFNAGMLLINVDYWRNHQLFSKFFDFVWKHREILLAHDQDTLNCFFYNKKKILPVTYNFQNGFIYRDAVFKDELGKDIERAKNNPAIVHYTCSKPWNLDCNNPMMYAWFYYKKKSLFSDAFLAKPVSIKMKVWYFIYRHNFYIHSIQKLPYNKYQKIILKK